MGNIRVLVVSDSHLSPRLPEAVANWGAVVADVAADPPAAVVHAGDVSRDGASHPDELVFAAARLADLPATVPLRAVPGNHDVGDNPHAGDPPAPVSEERLARYRASFGADRWALEVDAWALVGLDAQLFGSGLADEQDQAAWFADQLAGAAAAGRHAAVVVHKPLVPTPRCPGDVNPGRYLRGCGQHDLLARALATGQARVVVTGHTHQYASYRHGRATHVWAPSTWASLPAVMQPTTLGLRACGVVELVLRDTGGVTATLRTPPGLTPHVLGETTSPYD